MTKEQMLERRMRRWRRRRRRNEEEEEWPVSAKGGKLGSPTP